MTHLHVVPTGDALENHRFTDCPCRPRSKTIPRSDGTTELIHLHRALDEPDDAN